MKTYKVLKILVASATVILAIICFIIDFFDTQSTFNDKMVLSLLIFIATTSTIESVKEENHADYKIEAAKKDIIREIDSITDCKVEVFTSSSDWISRIDEAIASGKHAVDTVSLDSTVRTRDKRKYTQIFDHINRLSSSRDIEFRQIVRIRKNNLKNILQRVMRGANASNSYFATYELPNNFPFATYGVIDNLYVCARSPYDAGQTPHYLFIESKEISQYFQSWFDYLWRNATIITTADILLKYYDTYESEYTNEERMEICGYLDKLKGTTIVADI